MGFRSLADGASWGETLEERTPILEGREKDEAAVPTLIEKVPVSKICEEVRLAPSLFHRWQEQLFVNAALAPGDRRAPEPAGAAAHREAGTEDSEERKFCRNHGVARRIKKELGEF
jgi:hypothetical protein